MIREVILFSMVFAWTLSASTNPIGQKAHYQLDKNSSRTSSMIQSGVIDVEVTGHVPDATVPSYELLLDYKFKVTLMGSKSGSRTQLIDEAYFSEEFLDDLRTKGTYEGPNFKAKHLGYADAKTLNGKLYKHCDKIYLYDFQETEFAPAAAEMLFGISRADIEDLTAIAHIYPGLPVLGGVKLDLSGYHSGMHLKAGGDYMY